MQVSSSQLLRPAAASSTLSRLLLCGALLNGLACSGTVEDAFGPVRRDGARDAGRDRPERDAAAAESDAAATDAESDAAARDAESDAESGDAGSDGGDPMDASDAEPAGCGDGTIQPEETCDDGNSSAGDGCAADCKSLEQDYACPTPGEECVSTVKCGDGRVSGRETCDDANERAGDGCSAECAVEPGFVCQAAGSRCTAARCGDGIVAGDEQCDDDDDQTPADGDGCSASCRLESGFVCPEAGASCVATVCNDGNPQGSEPCDDGNQVVGDGCTPFCEVEPDCSGGACRSRCGDGLILPDDQEACDDGNTRNDDGCSKDCKVEEGYVCELEQRALPDVLAVPVTYRDFIARPTNGAVRHPDFEIFFGQQITPGLVTNALGMDGKPVYSGICDERGVPYPAEYPETGMCPFSQQTTNQASFDQWYRNVAGVNVGKVERMMLARDMTTGVYAIENAAFFPWDGDPNSWVGQNRELALDGHNFGFTSEIRTYFEFRGNAQTLTFSGDDDVWVFINRRLAVDIGGLHVERGRSVTLDAARAGELQLEAGKIYEIALFHAERHSLDSNFNLTLDGFASPRSKCLPRCGDGVVTTDEACDDGKNDGSYGSCTPECKRAGFCGDGMREDGEEDCDDGVNLTTYSATGEPGCAPGCKRSAYCGDEQVDSLSGEECDDGRNDGGYGECDRDCRLGARCGDGEVQAPVEDCDDGNLLGNDGCSGTCKGEGPA